MIITKLNSGINTPPIIHAIDIISIQMNGEISPVYANVCPFLSWKIFIFDCNVSSFIKIL